MKFRAIFLALALAACGQTGAEKAQTPAPGEPVDPYALYIEVGRYDVMLSHVENLNADRPGAAEQANEDPRAIARQLREVVWRYNRDRSDLCGRGLFTELSCAPAFSPVWINEPAASVATLDVLQARSNEVGAEVMRFWSAVCEDARTRETDEEARQYVCAIE
jgi:hypothetical protein